MSSKLKGFAKDSALYGLGEGLGKLGSIMLVPILSRIFLPSDYGIIDLLTISYAFIFVAVSLNTYTGLQKYYYLKSGEERKTLISSILLFRLLFSSLIAIIVILLASQISFIAFKKIDYSYEIILLAMLLPIDDVFSGLMLILRLNRKAATFSFYNLMQIVVMPIMTYTCIVHFHTGLKGVFIARLITMSILVIPLLVQQKSEFSKKLNFQDAIYLTKYSLPGLPAIMILDIMNLLPRYFLAYFSTLTAVGLFGMADRIAKLIDTFKSSFNRAWNPFAFSNAGKEDEKYLYEKVFKFFAIGLLLLILVLTLFAKEILFILTPPKYHSAAPLVTGLCFFYAIKALTLIYSTGFYSTNRVVYTSFLEAIQLCVFFISAIILIPYFKALGVVLSLDITAGVYFLCYTLATKKYFSFNFSFYRLFIMFVIAIVGCVIYSSYLTDDVSYPTILFSKVTFLLLYVIISYFIILTKHEKGRIKIRLGLSTRSLINCILVRV